MKIAISTKNKEGLQAEIDQKFGRAPFFAIIDTKKMDINFRDNSARSEASGAGVRAAQNIVDQDVEAVISGNFGPKAFNALHSAGLKLYAVDMEIIKQVVEDFKNGKLEELTKPTK